jgi:1-acyl-sn-glycerol-3-phosphate acyltransferase
MKPDQVSIGLGVFRFVRSTLHVCSGLPIVFLVFPRLNAEQRALRVQIWSQGLLRTLGIRLEVVGAPVNQGPALLVSNHISWLDIATLHAARYCRFISKADIQKWPLIGTLASGVGTLFIQREARRDTLRVVHHMADSLRAGDVLAIFPEGTTSDGRDLLPFHANLIEAAILAEAPVQPMSIKFVDAKSGEPSFAPCYIGDDTLIGSIWRTLTAPPIQAVVHFGEPQQAQGRDRRAWARDLRQDILQLRDAPLH